MNTNENQEEVPKGEDELFSEEKCEINEEEILQVASNFICSIVSRFYKQQKIGEHHGISHVISVFLNVRAALDDKREKQHNLFEVVSMYLAAYLHDVDDRKLFPKSKDYENARNLYRKFNKMLNSYIREHYITTHEEVKDEIKGSKKSEDAVIELISLVSARENGNSKVSSKDKWKLIVRDADRVEALGMVGVDRATDFGIERNMPFYIPGETPMPTTLKELEKYTDVKRFEEYMKTGKSKSTLDHYYDKLLHIGKLDSGNQFLQELAISRMKDMKLHLINTNKMIIFMGNTKFNSSTDNDFIHEKFATIQKEIDDTKSRITELEEQFESM
jgi:uncharacterized protein